MDRDGAAGRQIGRGPFPDVGMQGTPMAQSGTEITEALWFEVRYDGRRRSTIRTS